MKIDKCVFGQTKEGMIVDCYTLTDNGYLMEVLTYGGAIRSLVIPTSAGAVDVALGFDDVATYESHSFYFGAIIGRVANRIGDACFEINGKEYQLDANEGTNCLHGGFVGYDKMVWQARTEVDGLVMTLKDYNNKCGFPGKLDLEVKYSLKDGAVSIDYLASCDEDTPINLTNHCYFNLGGHDSGSIEGHRIQIVADYITPVDEKLAPTGALLSVSATPFDMRKSRIIGDDINSEDLQLLLGSGYDHNFVLSDESWRELSLVALLEFGGIKMQCLTTMPGIQLYCGNFITDTKGKNGAIYKKRSGLCLETQNWPDAVNKPGFPNMILSKGEQYRHSTIYKFVTGVVNCRRLINQV